MRLALVILSHPHGVSSLVVTSSPPADFERHPFPLPVLPHAGCKAQPQFPDSVPSSLLGKHGVEVGDTCAIIARNLLVGNSQRSVGKTRLQDSREAAERFVNQPSGRVVETPLPHPSPQTWPAFPFPPQAA